MKIFPLIMFEMSSINTLENHTGFLILPFLFSFQSSALKNKNINADTIAIVGKAMIISKDFIKSRKCRLLIPGLTDNANVIGKYFLTRN